MQKGFIAEAILISTVLFVLFVVTYHWGWQNGFDDCKAIFLEEKK